MAFLPHHPLPFICLAKLLFIPAARDQVPVIMSTILALLKINWRKCNLHSYSLQNFVGSKVLFVLFLNGFYAVLEGNGIFPIFQQCGSYIEHLPIIACALSTADITSFIK
jgi:hypothetical protein